MIPDNETRIPIKTEWRPDWKVIAMLAAFSIAFFWCAWEFGEAIARQAGIIH